MSEPSTVNDATGAYMFLTPDTKPTGRQVYLNGYVTDGSLFRTPASPNSATLGTAISGPQAMPVALFGVWKDCNNDGFIGWGENALLEYPAQLLSIPGAPGSTICPPSLVPALAHNYDNTVREFFPIVWGNMTFFSNRGYVNDSWVIYDGPSRVWVDKGRPVDEIGLICHIAPQPEGTFQTTGGAIAWVDCHMGYGVTRTANAIGTVGGHQIGFNDVDEGQNWKSKSVLNQRYPLGESRAEDSAVKVYDCGAKPTHSSTTPHVSVPDPSGGIIEEEIDGSPDGDLVTVFPQTINVYPTAPRTNSAGSVRGTANYTEEQVVENCNDGVDTNADGRDETDSFHPDKGESRADQTDCPERGIDFALMFVDPAYVCETPGKVVGGRIRPDVQLFPITPSDRNTTAPPPPTGDPVRDTVDTVNRATLRAIIAGQSALGMSLAQVWGTFETVDMKHGSHVQYVTTYGYVSPAAITAYGLTLPGTPGSYGSEACAAGVSSYNCDPNAWWKDAEGKDFNNLNIRDFRRQGEDATHWQIGDARVFLNQAFDVRDVDCYDLMLPLLRSEGLTPQQILSGSRCV